MLKKKKKKNIEARIPELIHADKMLYNQLRHETRSYKEIQESYQPLLGTAKNLPKTSFKIICKF